MPVVIDASFAAAWFLPDEQSDATDAVLFGLKGDPGMVPSLFWHETRNLFLMAERRRRLEPGAAAMCMIQLRRLSLYDAGAGSDHAVLTLAAKHMLSAYDASYLALALANGVSLASTDQRLAAAARAESVKLLGADRKSVV